MVQNHLLQLLCLVAMEPPSHMDQDRVRDEKVKVLSSLRPLTDRVVDPQTVRGQYRNGATDGVAVPGYLDEVGANRDSDTETFVALRAEIENWRWASVPFYLRTGKRMHERCSEIVVQYRPVPHLIFDGTEHTLHPNSATNPLLGPAEMKNEAAADRFPASPTGTIDSATIRNSPPQAALASSPDLILNILIGRNIL